jgi:hypothetical protein
MLSQNIVLLDMKLSLMVLLGMKNARELMDFSILIRPMELVLVNAISNITRAPATSRNNSL